MPRGLIVSLGTGPGVENAIAKSIRNANPEHLIFVASATSQATLDRVWLALGRKVDTSEQLLVTNEQNVEECYRVAVEAVRLLRRKGLTVQEIALDFTSGTKAMSAGLVLGASAMEAGSFVYVGGQRGPDGRVITGTELVMSLDPLQPWLDQRARQVTEFFNLYQFRSALQLLKEMGARTHEEKERTSIDAACHLVNAYDAWDKFDHQKAEEHFSKIQSLDRLQRWTIALQKNRGFLAALLKEKKRAHETNDLTARFSLALLVDLLLNAERRAQEGKFDDAVARLYRFTEMLAQTALARHHINTSDVDLSHLPETLREEIGKTRNHESRKIELALARSYALLESLGEPIGEAFRVNANLKNYLQRRNSSVLAHGIDPVTEKDYGALRKECVVLLDKVHPQWKGSASMGAFARLEMAG